MKKGIDISKWQGDIDFGKVAADGIGFVILREGYRRTVDPRFHEYVSGARQAGIPIAGVYHFSYALSAEDAIAEAQACIDHVKAAGLGADVIVFYDFEYDTVDQAKEKGVILGKAECISFTQAFCDHVKSRGYRAGVYTNMDYYRRMYTPETLEKYVLWLADYAGEPDVPCAYQQYSSTGKVSGIVGNVDMDYRYEEEKGMTVIIGSARSNENGGINGGKAGDQTGGEVSTQAWYLHSKGWVVIRPRRAETAEAVARCMERACANSNIGYCQDHRLSCYNAAQAVGFDCGEITTPCEVDCSELVRICVAYAGIHVGDFNTSSEADVLKATEEFDVLKDARYCRSQDHLQRGDILVTATKGHTVVVLNDGSKAEKKPAPITPGWKQAADGRWRYQYDVGDHQAGGWAYLEVSDGTYGWYLFDADGWMLTGCQTGPDGKQYYLCENPGVNEGKCMVTDDQGALRIAEYDRESRRYIV